MGKISPIVDEKIFFINKKKLIFDNTDFKNESINCSLHDSFNFLNLKIINKISNLILESQKINIICVGEFQKNVSDFADKLLKLGIFVECYSSIKENNIFIINLDLLDNEKYNISLNFNENSIIISNKENYSGINLIWAQSNLFEISLEKKLEVFFDCIYMNVLARKVL